MHGIPVLFGASQASLGPWFAILTEHDNSSGHLFKTPLLDPIPKGLGF